MDECAELGVLFGKPHIILRSAWAWVKGPTIGLVLLRTQHSILLRRHAADCERNADGEALDDAAIQSLNGCQTLCACR